MEYLPPSFDKDNIFELLHVSNEDGDLRQINNMDLEYDGHIWSRMMTANIKNDFGLKFKVTKCFKHLRCQNDIYPFFIH